MEKEIASQSLSVSGSGLHSQLWKETDFHSRILGWQNLNFSFWYLICRTPIKFQLNNYELSTETDNTLLVRWHFPFPHTALSSLHSGLTQFWEPGEGRDLSCQVAQIPAPSLPAVWLDAVTWRFLSLCFNRYNVEERYCSDSVAKCAAVGWAPEWALTSIIRIVLSPC